MVFQKFGRRIRWAAAAFAVPAVLGFGPGARAGVSYNWNGAGTSNGLWSDSANWNGTAIASNSLSNVTLAGTASLMTTLDLPAIGGSFALGTLTFDSTAGAFSIDTSGANLLANTLSLGAGGISVANANVQAVNVGVALSASQTFTTGTAGGTLLLNGALTATGQTLTFAGSGTVAIAGGLTGGALVQSGTGTTYLSGYTGATAPTAITVSSGTFAVNPVGGVNPIGTAPITLSGGTIAFRPLTNPVALTGFNQDVVAEVGATSATSYGTTASVDGTPGYIFYAKGFQGQVIGGLPTSGRFASLVSPTTTYQLASYTASNSLSLTGSGSTATGTLAISSPAAFNSLSILSATGSGNATFNFTLNFAGSTSTTVSGTTINDWFSGTGYAIDANGRYNRTSGAYDAVGLGNPRLYPTGYTLSATDAAKTLDSVTFTVTSFTQTSGTFNVFALSGAAAGTSQTYTNAVTVSANSTIDQTGLSGLTLGTLSINGSTLSTTGSNGSVLTLGQTTLTGNATFNTAAGTTAKSDIIAGGAFGLTKQGTGTFSLYGANTYTGPTTIQAGTLALTGTASLASSSIVVGDTAANSGAILDLSGLNSGTSLNIGTGQTLSGFGTVKGSHVVNNGGTILPGSATAVGTLTVGNETLNPGGNFKLVYNNTASTTVPGTTNNEVVGSSGSTLSLAGLSSTNKFNLNIAALVPTGSPGSTSPLTYVFASDPSITGATAGDVTSLFNVTGQFSGTPTVTLVAASGNNPALLEVTFVPVPETTPAFVLAAAAALAAAARQLRSRRAVGSVTWALR